MSQKIYVDNAASTPIDPHVIKLMVEIMENHHGNPSSIHSHGRKAKSIVEEARKKVAKIINASVGEVFFTSSATEANNTILMRSVKDLGVKTIISSPTEHDCVLRTLERLESEASVEVIFLKVNHQGDIDAAELESLINEHKIKGKVLVSLMHGNNEVGTLLDIERVAAICQANEVYFHSDMVQTIGKMEIDVQKTKLSFLSGSGHKFHGPKGVGFFYMNAENIIQPLILGGAQERNMRAGTENSVGIAGLAEALQLYANNRAANIAKVTQLRDYFEQQLLKLIPKVKINALGATNRLPHISSVSFDIGEKGDLLIFNLDIHGISASSGSACSSGIEHDSHVLIAIGHPSHRKTVRFSFSHFNTMEEVDQIVEILCKMQ